MSLTASQRSNLIDAYDTLKNRGMVFLAGRNDGKTRVFTQLTESTVEQQSNRTIIRARHSEDKDIQFVMNYFYARSSETMPDKFMRAIIRSLGMKPERGFYQMLQQWERVLADFAKQNRVLCVAVDNAELLPEKAFTILKYLNEFRHRGKDIGVAVVVAGEFGKMKMPIPFLKRTTEIKVGPITALGDIAQMIETHWPGMSSRFTEEALKKIASKDFETTLEKRDAAAKAIRKMKAIRNDVVDADTFRLALAA